MTTEIIVFAKAPVAGAVKTRLVPLLGAQGALALHRRLVEHSLRIALEAATGPVTLCCTPDRRHEFFAACTARWGVRLTDQADGDLGDRMHAALQAACGEDRRAILIGSDCASLTADDLRKAHAALAQGCSAVFTPAEDGGYMLVGVARSDPRLFERIEWGGARVMTDTRSRLRSLGWRWLELPTRWDIDRPEDYRRALREGLLDAGSAAA
jgi:rSAM/selenodomain-associated transferase 1